MHVRLQMGEIMVPLPPTKGCHGKSKGLLAVPGTWQPFNQNLLSKYKINPNVWNISMPSIYILTNSFWHMLLELTRTHPAAAQLIHLEVVSLQELLLSTCGRKVQLFNSPQFRSSLFVVVSFTSINLAILNYYWS